VESGGTASYNVLSDWIDPDGDDIFLKDVAADGGDEADFTPDGQITYRAIGGVQGARTYRSSCRTARRTAPASRATTSVRSARPCR
jgi:hypothetical protein